MREERHRAWACENVHLKVIDNQPWEAAPCDLHSIPMSIAVSQSSQNIRVTAIPLRYPTCQMGTLGTHVPCRSFARCGLWIAKMRLKSSPSRPMGFWGQVFEKPMTTWSNSSRQSEYEWIRKNHNEFIFDYIWSWMGWLLLVLLFDFQHIVGRSWILIHWKISTEKISCGAWLRAWAATAADDATPKLWMIDDIQFLTIHKMNMMNILLTRHMSLQDLPLQLTGRMYLEL